MKMWLSFATITITYLLSSCEAVVDGSDFNDIKDHPVKLDKMATMSSEDMAAMSAGVNCVDKEIDFDLLLHHKTHYKVGVHALTTLEETNDMYKHMFEEYLTATAGKRFDPPLTFEAIPMFSDTLYKAVDDGDIDFVFANSGIFSCIGIEWGAQALATAIARLEVRGLIYDLDVYGGVIFTQADNFEINTIYDLKDRIIGAGSPSVLAGGQLEIYEMEKAGLSYVMDPKQMVFVFNQEKVVEGVLNGDFEVGFARTKMIESFVDPATGEPVDPKKFKVIGSRTAILDNGQMFPFLHSTPVYPEWPIAALGHVSKDVSSEVADALLNLQAHSIIGHELEHCELDNAQNVSACKDAVMASEHRCDTTRQLAFYAFEIVKESQLAGFRPPRSYFEVRTMHEAAGFAQQNDKGEWQCTRAATMYDGIDCPDDHYKIPEDEFAESCAKQGLTCGEGFECYCKPCIKAFEVNIYEKGDGGNDKNLTFDGEGCSKMSVCGDVEQTHFVTFRAIDNLERVDAEVTARVHLGQTTQEMEVTKVPGKEFTYEFGFSQNEIGVAVMEIFFDGEQIPESPLRVQVIPRDCDTDYQGQNMEPDDQGNCVCATGTVTMGSKCVSTAIVAAISCVAAFIVVVTIAYFYIQWRNNKNDQMWQLNVDEIHFDDPVEVIGQGSFGVVLLAEYRGAKIAIKQAVKDSGKRGSTRASKSKVSGSIGRKSGSFGGSKGKTKHTASSLTGSLQDEDDGDDEGTHSTHDIETGDELHSSDSGSYAHSGKSGRSHSASGGYSKQTTSEDVSLGFLGTDFGNQKHWTRFLPWMRHEDYQSRFKDVILGESASGYSKTTFVGVFCPCLDENKRRQREFIEEMRVLSKLRHPCITTVVGAVMSKSHNPMLAMEYMEYGSLHDLLRNDTMYLSGEIIMQILRDVAQGLRYLHSAKPPILHGDMKARNILVDSRFRAKLCDFGLSTKNKNIITGTPFWLAPEYLRGQTHYNEACDMYSLGIILYEIYSRKSPYEGENFREVLRKVCDRRTNKRPPVPEQTPKKIADLMKRLWSPDASARPTAKDVDVMLMEMASSDAEPVEAGADKKQRTTTDMLYELFPRHVADALKAGQKVNPENHENVTVVFSDIVHFTDISRETTPLKVSNMLDRLYLAFDKIARKHQVFKVETIGDAYMGVTNLENNMDYTHVKNVAEFAVDMINEASQILIDEEDPSKGYINIRVGFHSGPVVSNVIGSLNPRYGLFGDTVNTASRMESNSKANRILCSERSYKLLCEQAPGMPTRKRGKIAVKGKGDMTVYWVGTSLIKANEQRLHEREEKHVGFQDASESHDEDEPSHSEPQANVTPVPASKPKVSREQDLDTLVAAATEKLGGSPKRQDESYFV